MTTPGEPLDLGVVGGGGQPPEPPPESSPDRPGRRAGRWRWAAVALAFVVGGVVGLVVADAREDATVHSRVELFGGQVQPVILGGERPDGELTVTVLNAGDRAVEIVGIEVEGMTLADGAEPGEPVEAEPGAWVTYVQRGIEVDCTGALPDGLRVRARAESGEEQLTEMAPPDNNDGLRGFWYLQCQAPYQFGLQVRDSAVIRTGDAEVVLGLELANDGPDDLSLGAIAARAPGFALTTDATELAIPAGESVAVETTWTVSDCETALSASGGSMAVRILHDGAETEQIIVLPEQGFVALARLSGRSCPATILE
ncbi:hypothetical protein [Jiangella alkaliphila]|uniref:Uncharacterized protein n=1 Tax=Jiangella alkaliphila TaxID=419479 RepID=A0A1H2KRK2_9ACTN|nr:hypothetical protein [Jiangella alkaliphila]SDU71051.1 hypothetical protein SAMN04488563_4142 [Jiangella alkaliphila]